MRDHLVIIRCALNVLSVCINVPAARTWESNPPSASLATSTASRAMHAVTVVGGSLISAHTCKCGLTCMRQYLATAMTSKGEQRLF